MFMAVGANGTLLTSPDGKAWLRRSSGTETTFGGVAFGARRFVIVGRDGLILESGKLAAPPVPTLSAALTKGGSCGWSSTGRGSGSSASRSRMTFRNGGFSSASGRLRPSRWSSLMNRPRQIAATFTALSRRSRFAFRLAKGAVGLAALT
ncbi:MAG: hypothetical protein Ct9H300mP32_6740 [Verrucomicrobiota bacterium]|nr:MAG: hypothetical protein Ct9H300mP32_6740 [Verrucomicrobiota bacterium]